MFSSSAFLKRIAILISVFVTLGGLPVAESASVSTVHAMQTGQTFVVNVAEDVNDGTCNAAHCSLREAIIAANATLEADTIMLPAGNYGLSITATVEPPVPTDLPTEVPTTTTPLPPQQILEAEAEVIQRTGLCTSYTTDLASGGSYLYSSGSLSDTLTLTFNGSQLDVIYIQHPALGLFALEVDGTVNQIIDAYAVDTVFSARTSISVPAGVHTLRILPISGTIAIDAFALDAQATVIVPAIEPTLIPPTSMPEPTSTPIPIPPPATFSFDSLSGWSPTSAWSLNPAGYNDSGLFISSAIRGEAHTLTLDAAVDLRLTFYPHLTFWQRGQRSAGNLLSVDISADGGQSWAVIDLSNRITTDWGLIDIDLMPFVGQTVAIRFRLDTMQSEGTRSTEYWLDEVTILESPPVSIPDIPLTEVPLEP